MRVLTNKRKYIGQNFHSIAGFMPQGWDLGLLGVKQFSVGICDGAPSTAHSSCDFVTFPFGILGQVRFLIVSIPDPCYPTGQRYENEVLHPHVLPISRNVGNYCLFQHGNARPDTWRMASICLRAGRVGTLDWLSRPLICPQSNISRIL